MRGFYISCGYMGFLPGENGYQLFESERAYQDFFLENYDSNQ